MEEKQPNFYDLYQKVGNIEGTLNQFTIKIDKCIDNHENRINCVEKSVDQMTGKATAIGAMAGFVTSIIIAILTLFKKDILGK
jgi:hypothetical protein